MKQKSIIVIAMTEKGGAERQVPLKVQSYLYTWVMAADRAVQRLPFQPWWSCHSKGVCGYGKKEKTVYEVHADLLE